MSSPRKLEEAFDLASDEAFKEVNKYIKGVYDILNQEANKVRKERETFDDVAKKLEHVHFSKMLKLNVGGHLFSTSLSTMNKDPGILDHVFYPFQRLKLRITPCYDLLKDREIYSKHCYGAMIYRVAMSAKENLNDEIEVS